MKLNFLVFKIRSQLCAGFLCLLFADAVYSNDWMNDTQWSAFVSQSAIYSSDYNFLSRSDDAVSLDMWEAGLLFSANMMEDLSFAAQLLGRKVSEYSDEDVRIDYAFLSYPFYRQYDYTLGLRLGRIRSSFGFYNETRDIPHTRTGIVMPQSVYFDMTRNSFYSSDGLEFFAFHDFGEFSEQRLGLQVFISKPVEDKDETREGARLNARDLDGDKSLLVKLAYGSELEGWRMALTYYRPEYDIGVSVPISETPLIVVDEENASFYSENVVTSLEYNAQSWAITGEYLRHKFFTRIPALDSISEGLGSRAFYEEAYYIQGLSRLSAQWEAYLRYDESWLRGQASYMTQFKDINAGVSFRPDEHWLIRAELHYIEGRGRLLSRDNEFYAGEPNAWHAALCQIAYRW